MSGRRLLPAARRRFRRWRRGLAYRRTGGTAPVPAPANVPAASNREHLVFLIVIDGLRPDLLDPGITPNLSRLAERGVLFTDGHAVFPSDTRVNAAAIATGTYPSANGVIGNSMMLRGQEGDSSLVTLKHQDVLAADRALNGRFLMTESLGEVLARSGRRLAAVSSASTGSALLLNHAAVGGTGVLVNGAFDPGALVAYPEPVNEAILSRFGPAPKKTGHGKPRADLIEWTHRVLMDYVVPELAPDVVIDWITEPDHTQHAFGVGSPEARLALSNVDESIGYVLGRLERLHLADRTDLFIVSDHGATRFEGSVDVQAALVESSLIAEGASPEVTVLTNGAGAQIHCPSRDPALVADIVSTIQRQEWAGPIFTAPAPPNGRTPDGMTSADGGSPFGYVDGTFSLDLAHLDCPGRAPDAFVTLRWNSRPNEFGVPGCSPSATPRMMHSGHGSISPWVMRTTLLGYGPNLCDGAVVTTPVSQVDLMPTILHLLGLDAGATDGRVLFEALRDGAGRSRPSVARETVTASVSSGSYEAALQVSRVGEHRYLDTGWRTADTESSPNAA